MVAPVPAATNGVSDYLVEQHDGIVVPLVREALDHLKAR